MSKTQLQTNNTRLASLIDELKGKAAGSGGGAALETCTVQYNLVDFTADVSPKLYYVKPDMSIGIAIDERTGAPGTVTILKNTVACVIASEETQLELNITVTGGLEVIENGLGQTNAILIKGDGNLFYSFG